MNIESQARKERQKRALLERRLQEMGLGQYVEARDDNARGADKRPNEWNLDEMAATDLTKLPVADISGEDEEE